MKDQRIGIIVQKNEDKGEKKLENKTNEKTE